MLQQVHSMLPQQIIIHPVAKQTVLLQKPHKRGGITFLLIPYLLEI